MRGSLLEEIKGPVCEPNNSLSCSVKVKNDGVMTPPSIEHRNIISYFKEKSHSLT
jgi:hypothetical protein